MTTETETAPRIYVASLSDYNAGHLHGRWIDATQDLEDIYLEIKEMLRESDYPNIEKRDYTCRECGHVWDAQVFYDESTLEEKIPSCPECKAEAPESPMIYPSAEEWAIHDHEGFTGWQPSEGESIETVAEVAALIEEHGDLFGLVLEHADGNIERAKQLMDEGYRGAHDSLEDYAREFCQDCYGEPPEWLTYYIDYEKMGKDWELGGDIFTIEHDGKVHIFDAIL